MAEEYSREWKRKWGESEMVNVSGWVGEDTASRPVTLHQQPHVLQESFFLIETKMFHEGDKWNDFS